MIQSSLMQPTSVPCAIATSTMTGPREPTPRDADTDSTTRSSTSLTSTWSPAKGQILLSSVVSQEKPRLCRDVAVDLLVMLMFPATVVRMRSRESRRWLKEVEEEEGGGEVGEEVVEEEPEGEETH